MTREQIAARDEIRLAAVHPDLALKVRTVLAAMNAFGHPMCVTASIRTTEEQQRLYAQGRTSPGHIVTNADGVLKRSNHQIRPDGYGHAVDCAFLIDGANKDGVLDTPSWDDAHPWLVYGAMAEALGLTWGGRWKMRDMPHVEMKA